MSEKLIFPIGFDLEEGVKEASKEWKSTYQKQLQKAIDDKPLKVKIDFESKGIDTKEFKQWMALSREAEKLERERIKNAKEWQKVAAPVAVYFGKRKLGEPMLLTSLMRELSVPIVRQRHRKCVRRMP